MSKKDQKGTPHAEASTIAWIGKKSGLKNDITLVAMEKEASGLTQERSQPVVEDSEPF